MKTHNKQLLVESALAAANHGLEKQALTILKVFPQLVEDIEERQVLSSLVYFALNKRADALRSLNGIKTAQADGLRFLYQSVPASADTTKICSLITGGQNGAQCNR